MNKEQARAMRGVLESLLKKEGYTFVIGNGSFDDTSVTFKVTASTGTRDDVERTKFEAQAWRFGMKPEHYGAEVKFLSGKTFRLYGFNARAHTAPVLARDVATGRTYKLNLDEVRRLLGLAPRPSLTSPA